MDRRAIIEMFDLGEADARGNLPEKTLETFGTELKTLNESYSSVSEAEREKLWNAYHTGYRSVKK